MKQEQDVLDEIKIQHKKWVNIRNTFNAIVIILGFTAIVTSVIVSVYTGSATDDSIAPKYLKVIAVISTASLTLLTAFNVVGIANNVSRASRHLGVAIFKYEAGVYKIRSLIEAYKEAEQIIGQFNFNYSPSQQVAPPSDPQQTTNGSTEQTNQIFYTMQGKQLIKDAVQEVKNKNDSNVLGVGTLPRIENGNTKYYLSLNVKDDATKEYYERNFKIKNGDEAIKPPMDINVTSDAETHSNKLPGTGIRNKTGANGDGTFGCVVRDENSKENCILSCQHVLKDDSNYDQPDTESTIILSDKSNNDFAKHIAGIRTDGLDAGLASLTDQSIDNKNLGILKGERDVNDFDVSINKAVSLRGYDPDQQSTFSQDGVIINNEFDIDIDYKDGKPKYKIKDSIVLSKSKTNFQPISKPGYSGSLVLDEDKCVIGMIVGGDDKFSYAIPINKIKSKLSFSILNIQK